MYIKIGKLLFLTILLYLEWFKEAYFPVDVLLYILIIAFTIVLVIDMKKTGNISMIRFPAILKTYFLLLTFSFITGVFIAKNQDVFISSIVRLSVFSCLCTECLYITQREKSVNWLLKIFFICALFCSLQTAVFGISYRGGAVTTMSPNNNPNKLGVTMVLGAMAILYDKVSLDKRPTVNLLILLSFIYVTMLAASRKCFISIMAIFLIWLKDFWQSAFSFRMTMKQLKGALFVSILSIFAVLFVVEKYDSTALFIRMTHFLTLSDMNTRLQLYNDAINMWLDNPIIGVGYAQFGVQNSFSVSRSFYYSHSTYAELLSCTGIIGFLIFFVPIFKKFIQCMKALYFENKYKKVDPLVKYKLRMIFLFFGIELFLATSQILFYELNHLLLLMVFFEETDNLKRQIFLTG